MNDQKPPSLAPSPLALGDVTRLEDILDRTAVAEVCRSFHALFGLSVRLFSESGALLADIHQERLVCKYVNSTPGGRRACAEKVTEVRSSIPDREQMIHHCFTGAVYRVVPILYDGRRLGRFVVGPYLPAEVREVPRTLLVIDERIEAERARDSLAEMPRVRQETAERLVAHFARILDQIVFAGHRAFLTSEMHLASVRESYRELSEKAQRLEHAYGRLQELDRLKSSFLATVSHELRTPLTSIIGYSEMLAAGLAGSLSKDQSEFVDTIRTKSDQLLMLITSLLDLSKLEQGQLELHLDLVDLPELLDEIVSTVQPTIAKRGISVVASSEALPKVHVDPIRLRQILQNLVDNAVKFSPDGGRITIAARIATHDESAEAGHLLFATPQRVLELRVQDNGIGIAPDQHARIFDAFYQVDGSSTRAHGGAGLGLSIVKRLVEAHHGDVRLESILGQGSTFVVTLPEALTESG